MGPDALIKQKIKQTRFRWARCSRACSACGRMWPSLAHHPACTASLTSCAAPPWLAREGYEEGLSTTHKVLSAAAFVAGDSPIEMLGQYTAIALEGPNSEGGWPGACQASQCAAAAAAAACSLHRGMMPKTNQTQQA